MQEQLRLQKQRENTHTKKKANGSSDHRFMLDLPPACKSAAANLMVEAETLRGLPDKGLAKQVFGPRSRDSLSRAETITTRMEMHACAQLKSSKLETSQKGKRQ